MPKIYTLKEKNVPIKVHKKIRVKEENRQETRVKKHACYVRV